MLSSYELNNTALELYAAEKDLGVWISKDLTWYKQVNEQSSRANKLLGYLKKNTRFILRTDVRRTLYIPSPIWDTPPKFGPHSPSSSLLSLSVSKDARLSLS